MKKFNIKAAALVGVFAAVISVISQFALPIPSLGAPLTLQTFGVMLAGFCQSPAAAVITMVTYTALGLVGAPVFSGYQGGASALIGPTGGFILGFIPLALFCALSGNFKNHTLKICLAALGLAFCHAFGVVQYSLVAGVKLSHSFMTASLPFILKDMVLGAAAYIVSLKVKNRWRF